MVVMDPAALGRRQAQALQQRVGAWFLLMYSPYWRSLVAFFTGDSDHGIVLKVADPEELWQLMNLVAPASWQTDVGRAVSAPPEVVRHDGVPLLQDT
ncbi:hypothetical protein ACWEJ6_49640 [Nonomuraea sp. NPDC004702]